MQAELELLTGIGSGDVTVSGANTVGDPLVVEFTGSLAGADHPPLVIRPADGTLAPSFTVTDRDGTRADAAVAWRFADEADAGETFVIDRSRLSRTDDAGESAGTDGTTSVRFDLSAAMVAATGDPARGTLTGGMTRTGDDAASPASGAFGTIIYYTVVQEEFADDFPSADRSVDHGDQLTGSVTLSAETRDNDDPTQPHDVGSPNTVVEAGNSSIRIAKGDLSTAIYAVNGATSFGSPVKLAAGDEITYRIRYTLPSSDFESLSFDDFLPLPVFDVADPDADGTPGTSGQATAWEFSPAGGIPGAGTLTLGPADTFYNSRPGFSDYLTTADLTVDPDLNALGIDFGSYDDPGSVGTEIDLLLTVTVNDSPFADGLSLTNLVDVTESNTSGSAQSENQVQNVIISTPELRLSKGVVSTTAAGGRILDADGNEVTGPIGGVTWNDPGSSPAFAGTVADPMAVDTDADTLDAGDRARVAVVVENFGQSPRGAFDVTVTDEIPDGYSLVAGSLTVTDGAGNALAFSGDLFAGGLELTDPASNEGSLAADGAVDAANIAVISYEIELDADAAAGPNVRYAGEAALTRYASREGGKNFITSGDVPNDDVEDDASVATPAATVARELVTTEVGGADGVASVGEEVTFRLTVTVPEGETPSLTLTDVLTPGLAVQSVDSITASAGLSTSVSGGFAAVAAAAVIDNPSSGTANDARRLTLDFGTVTNPGDNTATAETIVVEFTAVVTNTAAASSGADLGGTVTMEYVSDDAATDMTVETVTETATTDGLIVVEPSVSTAVTSDKTAIEAGETATFTITIAAADGTNTADAHDVALAVELADGLDYVANSFAVTSGPSPTTPASGTPTQNGDGEWVYLWDTLAEGETVTLTFQAQGSSDVVFEESSSLTAETVWTSVAGDRTTAAGGNAYGVERTGADNDQADNAPATTPGEAGANQYATTATRTVSIVKPAIATAITASSIDQTATGGVNRTTQATIGEYVTFETVVTLPSAAAPAATITIDLEQGLSLVTGTDTLVASGVTTDVSGGFAAISPTITGTGASGSTQRLVYSLGDLTDADTTAGNDGTITVTFDAVVHNLANSANSNSLNDRNDARSISADFDWTGRATATDADSGDVTVIEPYMQRNRILWVNGNNSTRVGDAGDDYTIRYELRPDTATNRADAFDVTFQDVLNDAFGSPEITRIQYRSPSNTFTNWYAGNAAPTQPELLEIFNAIELDGQTIQTKKDAGTGDLSTFDLLSGSRVLIWVEGTLDGSIGPGETVQQNVARSYWTSLDDEAADGDESIERHGRDPRDESRTGNTANWNDYNRTFPRRTLTVPGETLEASLFATGEAATAGDEVAVGEEVEFAVRVQLPEGTTSGLVIRGDLPAGIDFLSATVIDDAASSNGLLTEDFDGSVAISGTSGAGAASGDNVTVTFSDITLAGEDNATQEDDNAFLLVFRGRVANESGVAAAQSARAFTATYDLDGEVATDSSNVTASATAAPQVTVIEPDLQITMADSLATGDAGDAISHTYTVTHTGDSDHDAFDLIVDHTLPSQIDLSSATFTVRRHDGTGWTTLTAGASNDYVATVSGQTITVTGPDLEQGHTLEVVVAAALADDVQPEETITAAASRVRWTSLDDDVASGGSSVERDGEGSTNSYAASSGTTSVTIAGGTFAQSLFATDRAETAGSVVTHGEIATFALLVTLPEGETPNLRIRDRLPAALTFLSATIETDAADSGGLLSADFDGTVGALTVSNLSDPGEPFAAGHDALLSFGSTTVNGDNDTGDNAFLVLVEALVVGGASGNTPTNLADFDIDPAAADGYEATRSRGVTVALPSVTLAASLAVDGGEDAGDTATVSLTATNAGTADAHDLVITHDLSSLPVTNIQSLTVPTGWSYSLTGSVVTFTSNAGTKIAKGGGDVTLEFTADLTAAVQANQTLSTSASITEYSSLSGETAAESAEFTASATSNTVSHTIAAPTLAKSITATSIDAGPNASDEAVIGEAVTFEIVLTVPEGVTKDVVITDAVEAGLAIVPSTLTNASVTTASGVSVGSLSVGSTGQTVTVSLGDVTNANTDDGSNDTVTITFDAIVTNAAANDAGDTLGDTEASAAYKVGTTAQTAIKATSGAVTVIEPSLTITQTNDFGSGMSAGDADDSVTYTIVIANPAVGAADAYDLTFFDDVPEELDISTVTATKDTAGDLDSLFEIADPGTTGNSEVVRTKAGSTFDLAVGESVTIAITGTLRVAEVSPGEQIDNTAVVRWTSLDGSPAVERTGSGTAPNDYVSTADSDFTVRNPTLTRTILSTSRTSPSETASDRRAVVGELITYRIRIAVPEGTTAGAVLTDSLDAGLALVPGTVSFAHDVISRDDGVPGADTFTEAEIVSTSGTGVTGDAQTITFDFGTLTNAAADADAEHLDVTYTVRVLDDAAVVRGADLGADHEFDWDAGGPVTGSADDVAIVEPTLAVAQTITVNGTTYDDPATAPAADAGDAVTYTFTVSHAAVSDADAFDLTFLDTLPAAFDLANATVTATGGVGTATVGKTGQSLTVSGIDLAEGSTWTITVAGELKTATTLAGDTATNTGTVRWSSLDDDTAGDGQTAADPGERTHASATGAYTASSDAESFDVPAPTLAKTRVGTSISTVRNAAGEVVIGERITYRVTLTVPEGTTRDLTLTDLLPTGTTIDASSVSITVPANITPAAPTADTATAGQVSIAFGDIVNANDSNATAEQIVVEYDVVVGNVASNTSGAAIAGTTATAEWTGGSDLTATGAGVTVLEPKLTLEQTVRLNGVENGPDSPTGSPVGDGGDVIEYVYVIEHATGAGASNADAHELVLTDTLPDEVDLSSATIAQSGGTGTAALAVAGQGITVTGLDLIEGATATITLSATLKTSEVGLGETIVNDAANVTWTSLDGSDAGERDGSGDTAEDDYTADSNATAAATAGTVTVVHSLFETDDAGVTNTAVGEAAVGERVRLAMVVTLPESTATGLTLRELLPAGLAYDSVEVITTAADSNGLLAADFGGSVPAPTVSNHTDPGEAFASGHDPLLSFGTITTTGDNAAGNNAFVVVVTAVVSNDAAVDSGDTLAATAAFDTDGEVDTDATAATASATAPPEVDVVEPRLTVASSLAVNGDTQSPAAPTQTLTGDAGDAATLTLVVDHATAAPASTADAFDLAITQDVAAAVAFAAGDVTITRTDGASTTVVSGATVSVTGIAGGQRLTISGIDLAEDEQLTITIAGELADSVGPADAVTIAAASATWTSLDGTSVAERDGSGDTMPDDYAAAGQARSFGVPDAAYASSLFATSEADTAGSAVAVGETVTYAIEVTLPEGTTDGLVVRQAIPAGLRYLSSQLHTTAAGSGSRLSSDFAGSFAGTPYVVTTDALASNSGTALTGPAGSGEDVYFEFGTITADDAATGDDRFLLLVTAEIINEAGVDRGDTLAVVTTADSDGELTTDATAAGTVSVTVAEPTLTLTQSVTLNGVEHGPDNPTGSPIGDGGDAISFEYVITNTGGTNGADAYELILTDTLPDEIDLSSATIAQSGGTGTAALAVVGQGITVTGLDLDRGETATITLSASLKRTETDAGETITNTAANVTWTSIDGTSAGERDGSGDIAADDHTADSGTTTIAVARPTVVRQLVSTSQTDATNTAGEVVVGEVSTYRLTVTVPEGTTPDVALTDSLGLGQRFVAGSVSVARLSDGAATTDIASDETDFAPTVTGDGATAAQTLAFDLGTLSNANADNADAETFVITYQTVTLDVATQPAGTTFATSTAGTFDIAATATSMGAASSATATTLKRPELSITTSLDDATPHLGQSTTWTIEIEHTGDSDAVAYDLAIGDLLPSGVTLTPGSVSVTGATVVSNDSDAGELDVTLDKLAVGGTVTLTATVTFGTDASLYGDSFAFDPTVDWTTLPGTVLGEGAGTDQATGAAAASATVVGPEVGVSVDDSLTSVDAGDNPAYVVTVDNDGDDFATGVSVTVTLPPGVLQIVSTDRPADVTIDAVAGTITWDAGSIAAGADKSLSITTSVRDDIAAGIGDVTVAAAVTHDDIDPITGDDSDDDTDTVANSPDLYVDVSDGDATAEPGEPLTYTIDYGNAGTQGATTTGLTVTVPTGTTFVPTGSTAGWTTADAGATYTLATGTLAAGATGQATFVVRPDATQPAGRDGIALAVEIADDDANGPDPSGNDTDSEPTPLDAAPDLAIASTPDAATIRPGQTLTFDLDYDNLGDQGATGVTLTQTLPPGTTFDAAGSDAGWSTLDGTNYTLTIGSLAAGASGSAAFAVVVDDPVQAARELIESTATIFDDDLNGDDRDDDNEQADTSTPLDAAPDLVVTVDDGGATATPGGTTTYTLEYRNDGDQDAANVTLTQTLPPAATFVPGGSTAGWTTVDGETYTLSLGAVASGTTGSATFAVSLPSTVASGLDGLTVDATIADISGEDVTPADNEDDDDTPVAAVPDYRISIDDGLASAQPGDAMTATILVENVGNQDGTSVTVTSLLPLGLLDGVTASDGGVIDAASGTITWTLPTLDAGDDRTLTVSGTLIDAVPSGVTALPHAVSVADDGSDGDDPTDADDATNNNEASDTFAIVAVPDYGIAVDDGEVAVAPGSTVTYDVAITNGGDQDGTDLTATLTFDPTIVESVVDADGGTVDFAAGTITWDIASLDVGDRQDFAVVMKLRDAAGAAVVSHTVTAEVEDDGSDGADPTNPNRDTDVDLIAALPDYRVAIDDGLADAAPGDEATYTVTIGNDGDQDGSGVFAVATFDPTIVAAVLDADGGTVDFAAGRVEWTIGDLDAGDETTRTLRVRLADSVAAGVVDHRVDAEVDDDRTNGDDPDTGNNAAFDRDGIVASPDYAATVDDGLNDAIPGQTVTYTVSLTNDGDQDGTGVVATLDFDPAVIAAIDDADGGVVDATAGTITWTVGDLAADASQTRTVVARLVDIAPAGRDRYAAEVAVTDDKANGTDPNPSDNESDDATGLVAAPDYRIAIDNGVGTIRPGDATTYSITVENVGNQNGTGAVVVATFDPAIVGTIDDADGGAVDLAAGTITWSVGDLPAGSPVAFDVAVRIVDTVRAGAVANPVSVNVSDDGANGSDPTDDNDALDTDTVEAAPVYSITVDDGADERSPGEAVAITATITNDGDQDGTGVVATATVPIDLIESVIISDGGTLDPATGVVTWNLGDLPAGRTRTVRIDGAVVPSLASGVEGWTIDATVRDDNANGTAGDPDDREDQDTTTLVAVPDLVAGIDDARDAAVPGQTHEYAVSTVNVGDQDATGVTLVATIDPSVIDTIADAGGGTVDPAAGTVTWTVGDLASGATATRTLTLTLKPSVGPDATTEAVRVVTRDDAANGPDADPSDNDATDTDPIVAATDYAIGVDIAGDVTHPGDVVTVTIDFSNDGDRDGDGVQIIATYPPHLLDGVTVSHGGVIDPTAGTITWGIDDLPGGSDSSVTISGRVPASVPAADFAIDIDAQIVDGRGDGATDTDTTAIDAQPNYGVSIDDGRDSLTPGETTTYTATVDNGGPRDGTGVRLTITVDPELVAEITDLGGGDYDPATGQVVWSLDDLPSGGQTTRAITVRTDDSVEPDTLAMPVRAEVTDDGRGGPDADPSDNDATDENAIVAAPRLGTTLEATPTAGPGDRFRAEITFVNEGDRVAVDQPIVGRVPIEGLTNLEITATPGLAIALDPTTGRLTGEIPRLETGERVRIVVTGEIIPTLPAGLEQIVTTADPLPFDGLDGGTASAPLLAPTDLIAAPVYDLTVTAAPQLGPGGTYESTITVTNIGRQDGRDVTVRADVPIDTLLGPTLQTPPGTTGAVDPTHRLATVVIPELPVGESVQIVLVGELPPIIPDGFARLDTTVTVTDDGTGGGSEPTPPATASVTVSANPDYAIDIASEGEEFYRGDEIAYDIVVRNDGTQAGTGVVVATRFPAEALVDVTVSDDGRVDTQSGEIVWDLGELEVGEQRRLRVKARVAERLDSAVVGITHATIVTDDGRSGADPTPENNGDAETDLVLRGSTAPENYTYDGNRNEANPEWDRGGFGGSGIGQPSGGPPTLSEPGQSESESERPRATMFASRQPLRVKVLPPAVSPVYSGYAEPGTTVTAMIYDTEGRMIGERSVVADTGGNWLMTFPGSVIHEHPHRMDVRQTAAGYSGAVAGSSGYNLRRFFQPVIHSTIFFAEELSVGKVLRESAYQTVEAMHNAAEGENRFGWAAHAYEIVSGSSTVGES